MTVCPGKMPRRSRAASLEPGVNLLQVKAERNQMKPETFGQRRPGGKIPHPLGGDDDVDVRTTVHEVLVPPVQPGPVAAQLKRQREVRACATAGLPAGAFERVDAMAGHRPGIVKRPDARPQPRQHRQRRQAEIAVVNDVIVHEIRGAEARVQRQCQPLQMEHRLDGQQSSRPGRCPTRRADSWAG